MFSFGIEPSTTSTNGASSSPRAAARNGARNSSPPSVGDRTFVCRSPFGIPGIAPSSTSSMPGWPAAVTDTESPSQLIPSEIHRMWTSSTAGGAFGSVLMTCPPDRHVLFLLLELEGVDEQLLAAHDLEVESPAALAAQREVVERALRRARPAAAGRRHLLQHELRALGDRALGHQAERERQRVRHHLAQVPDADLDLRH